MNQAKIGKLIAKLRKEKGLTQQELGEKVNVGSRAVSKWERGLTLPDITIINELSKILGITSDELLKGELDNSKEKSTSKKPFNYKPLLILLPIIIIIVIIIFINNKDKNEVYLLRSLEPIKYQVEGNITINNNDITVSINKVEFQNYNFNQTIIKNCEYYLLSNNEIIYRYNYNQLTDSLNSKISVADFFKTFKMSYKLEKHNDIDEIIDNNLVLKIDLTDNNDNRLVQNIEIKSYKKLNE